MLREGQKVAYTGPANEGLILGDHGRLLVLASGSAHVSWETGTLAGQITPVALYDLSPARSVMTVQSDLDDSLDVAGITLVAARDLYDADGEVGVINAMAESGHLAAFQDIAEDALALVASRVRNDVSFREVLGQLDDEEGERVIRFAAACLIRDAFGVSEDG
jgi:hypothetical protein